MISDITLYNTALSHAVVNMGELMCLPKGWLIGTQLGKLL